MALASPPLASPPAGIAVSIPTLGIPALGLAFSMGLDVVRAMSSGIIIPRVFMLGTSPESTPTRSIPAARSSTAGITTASISTPNGESIANRDAGLANSRVWKLPGAKRDGNADQGEYAGWHADGDANDVRGGEASHSYRGLAGRLEKRGRGEVD